MAEKVLVGRILKHHAEVGSILGCSFKVSFVHGLEVYLPLQIVLNIPDVSGVDFVLNFLLLDYSCLEY